jgi:hypothetical protein
MPKRLLVARERAADLYFLVHLDEIHRLPDGRPDPDWLLERTWPRTPPAGRTLAQYRADILRELRALADDALARRADDAGNAIPGVSEGITL